MNTRVAMACLFTAGLLCAGRAMPADSDTDRSDAHAFVKDSAITTKVKAKLTADHASNLARVHVDTDKNGEVWLSGTVESRMIADRAVSLTKETEGVRMVHDQIKVKPED